MASNGTIRISSEDRREQILDVATDLFARQGYEGTTTREIAERGRVNEAIIFRHFPTKEHLYWAIIERRCQTSSRVKIIQESVRLGGGDRRVFTAIADGILRRKPDDVNITRLLLYSALERHELSDRFFRKYIAETYESLADYIRQRIAKGIFRQVDPLLAARGFLGMVVYHYLIQELYGGEKYQKFDTLHVAQTLTDIWLRGMMRPAIEKKSSRRGLVNPTMRGVRPKRALTSKPAGAGRGYARKLSD